MAIHSAVASVSQQAAPCDSLGNEKRHNCQPRTPAPPDVVLKALAVAEQLHSIEQIPEPYYLYSMPQFVPRRTLEVRRENRHAEMLR
jgi:hypothetical protein